MKTTQIKLIAIVSLLFTISTSKAQEPPTIEPKIKPASFGLIFGDPLGVTMKYRLGTHNAMNVSFGPDYYGSPRLQVDYVWQFNTFRSELVKAYAGPGVAVAFAKGANMFYSNEPFRESFASIEDKKAGIGGRMVFGFNFSPHSSLFELFVETGMLVGFNRYFDPDIDYGMGFRYAL
ncbi:MAG: hypothetical protein ACHQM6_07745 [Candidatus Kapaibacterium sp.]